MLYGKEHPLIAELQNNYVKGKLTRRQFMRNAAFLGASMSSIGFFLSGNSSRQKAAAMESNISVDDLARGGSMLVAMRVQRIDHPARLSWTAPANIFRHVLEYLTYTDFENVTHPRLLERWEPSDDLKTWTLYLRPEVYWSNGDQFVAEDVIFTMKEWLNPDVGSSVLGLMSYLNPNNIEKINDLTIKLHLDNAQIAVPEHLFHFPCFILNHRIFDGDILRRPVGTGPFILEEYVEDERAILRRREDYWDHGIDGNPLPYLDELRFVDLGEEQSALVSGFEAGRVHAFNPDDIQYALALDKNPNATLSSVTTGDVRLLRMRVDRPPWDDNRIRMALKLCQDREKIREMSHMGAGLLGEDHHIAPVYPAYYEMTPPEYNPERARELLKEAGYPDGIEVDIIVSSGWPDTVSYAEILQEDAIKAGIRLNIKPVPVSVYWDQWTDVDLGITPWSHRSLETMVLRLAYTVDRDGNPVAWNETRWHDEEFLSLLDKAEMTFDVDERRKINKKIQTIQQERGSIGVAFWRDRHIVYNRKLENIVAHPSNFYDFRSVFWKKE